MEQSSISHQGIVESVSAQSVIVRIMSESACATCHANGACSAADQQEKLVEVKYSGSSFKVGELVTVSSKQSTGFKAVFLGYGLPFILVISALIACKLFALKESTSGLISILVLFPYYAMLYLFRERLNQSFLFEIHK